MRWSERRTAVRHISDDFLTFTPSEARSRPPSLILFSLGLMALGFLTLFGYFFVLSFFGWPLFVFELVRHHLHFRYHVAGALAFLSMLVAFVVLGFIGSAFRIHSVDIGWWSWVIFGVWLAGPFVLWLILRLRRPKTIAHHDTKT